MIKKRVNLRKILITLSPEYLLSVGVEIFTEYNKQAFPNGKKPRLCTRDYCLSS